MLALENIGEKKEKANRTHWFFRGKKTNRQIEVGFGGVFCLGVSVRGVCCGCLLRVCCLPVWGF